jgi:hypothetical protein
MPIKHHAVWLKPSMIRRRAPQPHCSGALSSFKRDRAVDNSNQYRVRTVFIMLEDRRFFGGRYVHMHQRDGDDLKIVFRRQNSRIATRFFHY